MDLVRVLYLVIVEMVNAFRGGFIVTTITDYMMIIGSSDCTRATPSQLQW